MSSNWKAKTLTLAVLSFGILFQPMAFGYDPDVFPGKGSKSEFKQCCLLSNQATTLQEQGRTKEALALFKQVVQRYPFAASFHYNLGKTYSKVSEFPNAIASYRSAIKLAPDFTDAYINLSDVQFKVRNYEGAEEAAAKAATLNSKDPAIYINLAQAEIALKKLSKAKEHLQIARRLPGGSEFSSDLDSLNKQLKMITSKTAEN